jgi:hypothetical protein
MNTVDTVIASVDGTRLSLAGLLRWLRARGRLGPLVREALAAQLVKEQARQAGLSATAEELQAAADAFRRRHGLNAAADTRAWLAAKSMTVDDLEEGLEEGLLADKFRQHVTANQVDRHWQEHQAGYERLRLALVTVGREELARELASQVREDGRTLADVVREHGLALDRGARLRKDLGSPLAEALAAAPIGQLVGPVATARDFTLAVVEERRPAELDTATRQLIRDELFEAWLAERLQRATFNATVAETSE